MEEVRVVEAIVAGVLLATEEESVRKGREKSKSSSEGKRGSSKAGCSLLVGLLLLLLLLLSCSMLLLSMLLPVLLPRRSFRLLLLNAPARSPRGLSGEAAFLPAAVAIVGAVLLVLVLVL